MRDPAVWPETQYENPRQGPAITITEDSLQIDASQATIPTAEFSWLYLDESRSRLAARLHGNPVAPLA